MIYLASRSRNGFSASSNSFGSKYPRRLQLLMIYIEGRILVRSLFDTSSMYTHLACIGNIDNAFGIIGYHRFNDTCQIFSSEIVIASEACLMTESKDGIEDVHNIQPCINGRLSDPTWGI